MKPTSASVTSAAQTALRDELFDGSIPHPQETTDQRMRPASVIIQN